MTAATRWQSFAEALGKPRVLAAELVVALVAAVALYAGAVAVMTQWSEIRGVWDDQCYLRQAQLFKRHGPIAGLDTDMRYEPARYIVGKAAALDLPAAHSYAPPCHRLIQATGKIAIQYPPGTGLLLSPFPDGQQSRWLYIAAATAMLLLVGAALLTSRSAIMLGTIAALGCAMVYFMVNPTRSSYSLAPTMPLCVALGFLTVRLFLAKQRSTRLALAAGAGLLLGIAGTIRISSVFLAAGYFAVFAMLVLHERSREALGRIGLFGTAFLVGVAPVLAANAINAGHVLATPYGPADTMAPEVSLKTVGGQFVFYLSHGQGLLLMLAVAALLVLMLAARRLPLHRAQAVAGIVALNLLVNMAYYLTHPVVTKYYTIPLSVLSVWTVVFLFHAHDRARPLAAFGDLFAWAGARRLRAALAALLGFSVVAILATVPGRIDRHPTPAIVTFPIDPRAVVWTEFTGSVFPIAVDRYAASGLAGSAPNVQDRLMAAIMKDGRTQYIVLDSPDAEAVLLRARKLGKVEPAGEAFGRRVFRLQPAS